MSASDPDFYRVLGLNPNTPPQALAAHISGLIGSVGPGPDRDFLAHARAVLGDPAAKAAYDARLFGPVPRQTEPNPFTKHLARYVGVGVPMLSSRERAALDRAHVRSDSLRGVLVWRRAALILVLPLLVLYTAALVLSAASDHDQTFSTLGLVATAWVPAIAFCVLTAAVLVVIVGWAETRLTTQLLFWSWLLTTASPVVSLTFPVRWYLNTGYLHQLTATAGYSDEQFMELFRPAWTTAVAITVLPTVFALLSGVLRGLRKTKSVFPASTLPGWFLSVIAPFYVVVLVSLYSVVAPNISSALALLGVILLLAAQGVFVACRRRYITPLTHAQAAVALRVPWIVAMSFSLAGAAVLIVYACTGHAFGRRIFGSTEQTGDGQAWYDYTDSTHFISIYVRFIITSVVMVFIFIAVLRKDWSLHTGMHADLRRERDAEMTHLEIAHSRAHQAPAPTAHTYPHQDVHPAPPRR